MGILLCILAQPVSAENLPGGAKAIAESSKQEKAVIPPIPRPKNTNIAPNLFGSGLGRKSGSASATSSSGGNCNVSPNSDMTSNFESCGGNGSGKSYMLVDADQKVAFVYKDNSYYCVPITVGSASNGSPAVLGSSTNQSRQGMFRAQPHNGEKYRTQDTNSSNYNVDSDAISIGDGAGRVIHSSHGNSTTAGCIGIGGNPNSKANADANFIRVKQDLGVDGGEVFVYGSNYRNQCGSSYGIPNYRPGSKGVTEDGRQ